MVVSDAAIAAIVRRCYVEAESFTNLKQLYGRLADLRYVVNALAGRIGDADAVASTDERTAPLAALVAHESSLPTVFVRRHAMRHGVLYGEAPVGETPSLSGDRLPEGARVHVVDDFVHSGASLGLAVKILRGVGPSVGTAAALLGSPPASASTHAVPRP